MQDCIFCKIVAGEMPSYKIYEDDLFYGLLDIHPVSKGHALLIPKIHYRWVHDVPEFGKYWEAALKVVKAVQKSLNPKWVQYFSHGAVPHAHIHVIPRYEDIKDAQVLPPWSNHLNISKQEFEELAEKISNALK